MPDIESFNPRTGRLVKEDGDMMNIADAFETLLAAGEVTTIDITAIGEKTDATVTTDHEAAQATVLSLLRGILAELQAQTALLTQIEANQ